MLIYHKGHTDTIQVYSVTVMTHVKALQAGHSSQGTSEPISPASRVSASRTRFSWLWRHYEDADSFADAITDLCRVGYPQSSPELRQELISEQFVRGQSDPELKKYLWVDIRTQKDRKLQTLIEICTDFASLSPSSNIHRPAEQVFAVEDIHRPVEQVFAVEDESEDMFENGPNCKQL